VRLITEPYLIQVSKWPKAGRHILAQYDDHSIVVYQAYRPAIGNFAASNGYFGGEFELDRMSWIKTNFLWMMYRSGWGTTPGQEVVLAIWLKRSAFEEILTKAVHSSYVPKLYSTRQAWQKSLKHSQVRLQWDPDHHPSGAKLERRAMQLGLRGEILAAYVRCRRNHRRPCAPRATSSRRSTCPSGADACGRSPSPTSARGGRNCPRAGPD